MNTVPFDKRQGKAWVNGEITDWQDAKIHILNHGLHYGSSVYEGIRVYNHIPFKVHEHMQRLLDSANEIGFSLPYSVAQLTDACLEQISLNNIANGYVRPIAWRGSETMLIGGKDCSINTAVFVWSSFESARNTLRETGIRLTISKWRKPRPDASPFRAKAASIYTLATMIKNEAENRGFDDALVLDDAGNITEATTSNFFTIKNSKLYTPTPDCFINGITRQTIIEVARDLNIEVIEGKITPEFVQSADSCFLTGTAIEIMPIKQIDEFLYDINHPMLQILTTAFKNAVANYSPK